MKVCDFKLRKILMSFERGAVAVAKLVDGRWHKNKEKEDHSSHKGVSEDKLEASPLVISIASTL